MNLRKVFSLLIACLLSFSCAGKKELIQEIQSTKDVFDGFYRSDYTQAEPLSSRSYETVREGSYETPYGIAGRKDVFLKVREKRRQTDF